MRSLIALLVLSTITWAQSVDTITPECAAPGDRILISGSEFGEEPTVSIGGTEVEVIRSSETRILVRVPEDADAGTATVDVDGATADLDVLEANAPTILHLTSTTATPGQSILLIGYRLRDATVELRDDEGTAVFSGDLRGRRRAGFFTVPSDIEAGTYSLVLVGAAEGNPESCARRFEVVEAGDPTITDATPEEQTPGRAVTFEGTDLGPLGWCRVEWTDDEDNTVRRFGVANGYDKVYTRVPFNATPGATYSIKITFSDDSSTEAGGEFEYTVGDFPAPEIEEIKPESGPAGDIIELKGVGLFALRDLPVVEFTQGDISVEARVFGGYVGFRGEGEFLAVLVPGDLADGDYDVTVTVGDQTSNAVSFTVETPPLAVTSMTPTTQGTRGPRRPVIIEGSGFGPISEVEFNGGRNDFSIDWKLAVTWDDGNGGEPLEGIILHKTDGEVVVLTPGGWRNPLAAGTYTVRVIRNPGTDSEESVEAGTFTVE